MNPLYNSEETLQEVTMGLMTNTALIIIGATLVGMALGFGIIKLRGEVKE